MTPEQQIESWVSKRKEAETADLSLSVIRELQKRELKKSSKFFEFPKLPRWVLATSCLVAGVGKFILIHQLAF